MKINKKQKKIMRGGALVLFSIALILILKLVFNINFNGYNDNPYNGTWYIGYKYYEGDNTDKLVFVYARKLHLFSDNTFSMEIEESYVANDTIISGTYRIDDDKLTLSYTSKGQEAKEEYYLIGNKICTSRSCGTYYTRDKIEKYFEQFNTVVEEE